MVNILLDRGADAGVKDSLGRSAPGLAEADRNQACIHLLKVHVNEDVWSIM